MKRDSAVRAAHAARASRRAAVTRYWMPVAGALLLLPTIQCTDAAHREFVEELDEAVTSAAGDYSSPEATYRTFLNAVKNDDSVGAVACWTVSDGNESKVLDVLVGVWVTMHEFGKITRDTIGDYDGQMLRPDCTDEAIDLTLSRLTASEASIAGDTAKLPIKWEKGDGYPTPAFFYSDAPIPFRLEDGSWKIDAHAHGNLPTDPAAGVWSRYRRWVGR
jgi:hypothetical protein